MKQAAISTLLKDEPLILNMEVWVDSEVKAVSPTGRCDG
jgi:hypothetical protein